MGRYRLRVLEIRLPIHAFVELTRKYEDIPPSCLCMLTYVSSLTQLLSLFTEAYTRDESGKNEERFEKYLLEHTIYLQLSTMAERNQDIVNATAKCKFNTDVQIEFFNGVVHPKLKEIEQHYLNKMEIIKCAYIRSDYTTAMRKWAISSCEGLYKAMAAVMLYEIDKFLEMV